MIANEHLHVLLPAIMHISRRYFHSGSHTCAIAAIVIDFVYVRTQERFLIGTNGSWSVTKLISRQVYIESDVKLSRKIYKKGEREKEKTGSEL